MTAQLLAKPTAADIATTADALVKEAATYTRTFWEAGTEPTLAERERIAQRNVLAMAGHNALYLSRLPGQTDETRALYLRVIDELTSRSNALRA